MCVTDSPFIRACVLGRILAMKIDDHRDIVGVTELANCSSRLVRQAEAGRTIVVLRNNKATAALMGMGKLQELEDLEEDLSLMALAIARLMTDGGNRTSHDAVLARFGLTREELASLPDEDEVDEG